MNISSITRPFLSITTARWTSRRSLPIRTYARPYSSSYAPAPIRSRLDAWTGSWLALRCNISSINQYFSSIKQTFSSIKQTEVYIHKKTFSSIKQIITSINQDKLTHPLHESSLLIHKKAKLYPSLPWIDKCRRVIPWLADEQRSHLHPPRPNDEVQV